MAELDAKFIVRIEVHRERLISALQVSRRRFREDDPQDWRSMSDEQRLRFECERQADDTAAILSCIRLVLEPA